MKTLIESILGNNNAGIEVTIKQWCDDHNIYDGAYEIIKVGNKPCIKPTGTSEKQLNLELDYADYNELPEYINFVGCDSINVRIGVVRGKLSTVKSFRGVPNLAKTVWIFNLRNDVVPELDIKVCDVFATYVECKAYKRLNIEFTGDHGRFDLRRWFYYEDDAPRLDNITLKNVECINLQQGGYGDKFSKMMARKAVMNKYRNKYTDPVSPEGLKVINTFLKNLGLNYDDADVNEIDYTQESRVVRYRGEWYRCKNW